MEGHKSRHLIGKKAHILHPYVLRKAIAADAPQVLRLYKDCAAQPGCHWNEEYPNQDILREDMEQGALFIAEQAGDMVGVVSLLRTDDIEEMDLPFLYTENPCVLTRLGLCPRLRGKGLGRVLLCAAEEKAMALGYAAIHLLCDMRHPSAHALYQRGGYRQVCTVALYGAEYMAYEKGLLTANA